MNRHQGEGRPCPVQLHHAEEPYRAQGIGIRSKQRVGTRHAQIAESRGHTRRRHRTQKQRRQAEEGQVPRLDAVNGFDRGSRTEG